MAEGAGGRHMVLDATALAFRGLDEGYGVYLIANNRAWGNAPLLSQAIANRILDEEDRRRT